MIQEVYSEMVGGNTSRKERAKITKRVARVMLTITRYKDEHVDHSIEYRNEVTVHKLIVHN